TGSAVQWSPKTGERLVNIEVSLSKAAVDPVTVAVVEDSAKICNLAEPVDIVAANCLSAVQSLICPAGSTCNAAALKLRRARSVVGTTYNRFDWDFKFQSTSLVFLPGEQKKTLQVKFSKDIRKEDNFLLTLKLEAGLGDVVVGSSALKHFVIEKISHPTPPVGVARFQDLMQPVNGILAVNCMQCHNSTKREGQYDISNYEEMISRGVLVPGSTTSKMFRRINPMDPDWANLQPMPRTGPMEDSYIRAVQKWIEAGAPNN
ncbi:MAG: c-type cytochrome domain-containing protein, partial [Bdellovibrio sp.]